MSLPHLDPTQIVTAWTAVIAVLSLANKFVLAPFAPKVARFVSAIISLPTGHLANFIEDIQQLYADVTGGPPTGSSTGSPPASPPPSPKPPTAIRGKVGLATLFGFVMLLGLIPAACTPAQQALEAKVEQMILNDLAAGKTATQIEADIGQLVAGQPGADAVVILNDALAFLIDIGVIPPGFIPQAQAMLTEVKPVAMAHRAAK
jgi:hypothetical protein